MHPYCTIVGIAIAIAGLASMDTKALGTGVALIIVSGALAPRSCE